jgi:hypothetical protein
VDIIVTFEFGGAEGSGARILRAFVMSIEMGGSLHVGVLI